MSTGAEYIEAITHFESDRRTRAAFQELVMKVTPQGAGIFDFGAGPGLDAKFYAQQGFNVVAYDVDARMCSTFLEFCKQEITARQVELLRGSYREFLDTLVPAIRDRVGVAVITANFAPLNMIEDLHELFARFHALTHSGARIVTSVLHPYFIGHVRHRLWWRNRLRGCYEYPSMTGTVFRRSVSNFRSQAAPYFTLEGLANGLPGRNGLQLRRANWVSFTASRYLFLVFRRQG